MMQNKISEIQLHDIKPLLDIQEYSLYYFWSLILLVILIFLSILYLVIKYIKNKNAYSIRKEHYKLLSKVNFKDPKKSAYDVTFYGEVFKNDSQKHLDVYENMIEKLEEYKYKKNVKDIEKEVKSYVQHYRDMIDV